MSFAHRVCFTCRKSWSIASRKTVRYTWNDTPGNCPECNQPLIGLGLYFKPPKQNDIREWRKVEAMVHAGCNFTSADSSTPITLAQAEDYSDVMREYRSSKGEKLARKFNKKRRSKTTR